MTLSSTVKMFSWLVILVFAHNTHQAYGNECNVEGERKDADYYNNYFECINGTYQLQQCPDREEYDRYNFECIPSSTPYYPNDYESTIIVGDLENDTIAITEEINQDYTEVTTQEEDVDTTGSVSEKENAIVVEENTKHGIFIPEEDSGGPESVIVDKSISAGSKRQELEKPLAWTGPIVKTQSVRTKANWTTTVLNGEPVYTDISVYNSHGRSYQFRIPGGLPSDLPGGIIAWVRSNAHLYPKIDIEYHEYGSDIEKHLSPPTELPPQCGKTFLEKLSGGKASPIEENPWQVAVLRRDVESYVCGGAIITRRHILSAAHCFRRTRLSYTPEDILLRVGDYDKEVREESQVDYLVAQLAIHPGYHEKRHLHDIALLTTSEDIPFSSHIYPICLPTPWADYTPGLSCTVSGWGQVGLDDVPTRYLRSGQVSIVSKEDCRKKTIFSRGVPPEIFCAEDPTRKGVDTCLGDSGGPFACNRNGTFYLFGITAFGSYPCGQDIPSFYTNVSFYRVWILYIIGQGSNSTSPNLVA